MARYPRAVTAPAIALVAVFTVACTPGAPVATQTPSPAPAQSLECEEKAYPCAFADIEPDVRVHTDQLIMDATARIDGGATNDELTAWLESEPLVAEVEGDAYSVRFRPNGGRSVWITRRTDGVGQAPSPSRRFLGLSGALEEAGTELHVNASVTGAGRSARSALVLSPYRWDFGDSDDGAAVAEQLRQLPDYANGVTYAENATIDSTDVTIEDFKGWDARHVVHLVSHGARLCKDGKCRAVVAANVLAGGTANLYPSTIRGLELEVDVGSPGAPRYHVLLGADAFRDEYPAGLGDTVVFLNGCSTFGPGATDLADAIRGSGSVVLGWSKPVDSVAAQTASLAMYDELAGSGRPVGEALDHIGNLATDSVSSSILTSSGRAAGGDLRIREVAELEAPQSGEALAAGANVPLIGESGDGVPDAVLWRVQVDGIQPAAAATALVQVTIDGHVAPPITVATGAAEANDSWEISGHLELGVDINAPHPALFEVTLALPDGGTSVDSASAVLIAESDPTPAVEAPMSGVAEGKLTERSEVKPGVERVVEAEITFTLSPDAGPRYFAYDAAGGTMTFSQSGTTPDGSCTNAYGPTDFQLDAESLSGGFTIDATTSPPTFSGSVTVTGPEIEVQQTCTGEFAYLTGTYSTRASANFIQVYSSEEPIVPVVDGRVSGRSLYGDRTFDISASE